MKHFVLNVALLITVPQFSLAGKTQKKLIHESYSVIRSEKAKIGFAISRYEFYPKSKRWVFISYTKTNSLGGNITEKLIAVSDKKLKPVSFSYEGSQPGEQKKLRASFKKNKMILKEEITRSQKKPQKRTLTKTLPKGTFLSSFLNYMIFHSQQKKSHKKIKPGFRFSYNAVAEEDGQVELGSSYIQKKEAYKNLVLFRVITDFKKSQVTSLISPQGEAVYALSPVQKISVEMVTNPSQATRGIEYNAKDIQTLFGQKPKGLKNALREQIRRF